MAIGEKFMDDDYDYEILVSRQKYATEYFKAHDAQM